MTWEASTWRGASCRGAKRCIWFNPYVKDALPWTTDFGADFQRMVSIQLTKSGESEYEINQASNFDLFFLNSDGLQPNGHESWPPT